MTAEILLMVTMIVFGSALHGTAQAGAAKADKWQAPPEAAARPNPESGNPAAPATGRKLFTRVCSTCHGEDASGHESRGANLRSRGVQAQSDGALFWKITTGNTTRGMPSFAGLSETTRWDIVTFLRTLSDSAGAESSGEGKKPAPDDNHKQP